MKDIAEGDWQAMCEAERRFSAKQAAEIVRLSGELSQARAQVAELQALQVTEQTCLDKMKQERDQALALVEDAGTRPRNFLAWAVGMFGPVAKLRSERLMRFVEEAIELAHADGMERVTLDAIASRVYGRERGEIRKEIGQAQACLETYAENIGESASSLAEIEWQRVQRIPSEEWQRRHKAKQDIGIALSHSSTVSQAAKRNSDKSWKLEAEAYEADAVRLEAEVDWLRSRNKELHDLNGALAGSADLLEEAEKKITQLCEDHRFCQDSWNTVATNLLNRQKECDQLRARVESLTAAVAAAHAAFQAIPIGYPLQQNGRTIDHTLLNMAKDLCERASEHPPHERKVGQ